MSKTLWEGVAATCQFKRVSRAKIKPTQPAKNIVPPTRLINFGIKKPSQATGCKARKGHGSCEGPLGCVAAFRGGMKAVENGIALKS